MPGNDDVRNDVVAEGCDGFARLLRAEFTKFRTVRAWMIALCTPAVVLVLLSFVSALASRATNPALPTGPDGEAVTDTYMFVHQTLVGDGTLTAKVAALSGAFAPPQTSGGGIKVSSQSQPNSQLQPGLAPWSKAGIILEPDTNQGIRYAAVIVTGYYSTDGAHWTETGTARLASLPHTVQIGLFVTSPVYFAAGDTTGAPSVATATFDNISTHGDLPDRTWTADAIAGLYTTVPSASTWQQRTADAFTISGSGDIAPLVGGEGPATHWAGASIVNGTIVALLMVIVLAALFVTSEYRRGLIRTTFAASPRRGPVLAAKATVAGTLTFAAAATATAIAELITRHVLAANGNYLFPQSGPDLARVIIGTGLLLGLAAALTVALGAMLRRSAGTVAAGIALLVLPGVLGSESGNWLMQLTPTAAFAIQATLPRSNLVTGAYTPPNGYFPISPWAGLAVLAAYTAVAMGAATWLIRRRDA